MDAYSRSRRRPKWKGICGRARSRKRKSSSSSFVTLCLICVVMLSLALFDSLCIPLRWPSLTVSSAAAVLRPNNSNSRTHQIPRQIHQIWIGSYLQKEKPTMPPACEPLTTAVQRAHTSGGWKYTLHGNELWQTYAEDKVVKDFVSEGKGPSKVAIAMFASYFALLLLRDHGGIYIDVKMQLVQPSLAQLLESMDLSITFAAGMHSWAPQKPKTVIDMSVLMSAKGSKVIKGVVEQCSRVENQQFAKKQRPMLLNPPAAYRTQLGRLMTTHFDEKTLLLGYAYFYPADTDMLPNNSTVTMVSKSCSAALGSRLSYT